MRRGRRLVKEKPNSKFKYLLYLSAGTLIIIILTFIITFIVYNNKLKDSAYKALQTEKIAQLVPNDEETESTSTDMGKTIEEVIKQTEEQVQNTIESAKIENNQPEEVKETTAEVEEPKEVIIKDPEFIIPIEGEIVREFAKDSLIYSNTLEEWITHLGIDIKAPRTSVVKAAESGNVVAIKNDPRYGLTIIIEHANGYKSIYSNLLTTEFVTEGETVNKSQSIGTVGNSASFEIADEPHLHFEILKNNENVNPSLYIK